jgi:catechol 2,3-dioxygenase-like lactoylglutathione lyase family enzyme
MIAFYSEAFKIQFHEVDTFGIPSQFGDIGGVTLKLVPIRDASDFEGFPLHQLGFNVPDPEAIIRIARQHGGRLEGRILRDGEKVHAAIRDPDGNTVELYSESQPGNRVPS